MKHEHNWLIRYADIPYRDIEGNKYVIDIYQCECGAGGEVKTPLEIFEQGNKRLGIEGFDNGRVE